MNERDRLEAVEAERDRLRGAAQEAAIWLGSGAGECEVNECDGCKHEMGTAAKLLREALHPSQPKEKEFVVWTWPVADSGREYHARCVGCGHDGPLRADEEAAHEDLAVHVREGHQP